MWKGRGASLGMRGEEWCLWWPFGEVRCGYSRAVVGLGFRNGCT